MMVTPSQIKGNVIVQHQQKEKAKNKSQVETSAGKRIEQIQVREKTKAYMVEVYKTADGLKNVIGCSYLSLLVI